MSSCVEQRYTNHWLYLYLYLFLKRHTLESKLLYSEIITCRFLGLEKLGGSGLKASIAAAVVACTWIYNAAFSIPVFIWADVRISSWSATVTCLSNSDPAYMLAARIINFLVPLIVTWTSYIGIIYKLKRSANKALFCLLAITQNFLPPHADSSSPRRTQRRQA